ncbi:MAG: DUF3696 domain-containing protein [Synechococcus sp. SB0678_bin_12]|nr:DUF3696 domain-containing protein [Synechococcus sp. SB0678_bin_12]
MLTQLDLDHFKCFASLRLPLAPLTLLSGINAAGKSSVLQALVLLHQTMHDHEWSDKLMLNGSVVDLGTVADVVDQVYGRRECMIALMDDETPYQWTFAGERKDMAMAMTRVTVDDDEVKNPSGLQRLLPSSHGKGSLAQRLHRLTYLTAERMGPRELYALDPSQRTPGVGTGGESTISILYSGRDDQVLPKLVLRDTPPTRLRQVEKRMQQFFPGCVLDLNKVPRTNSVTLGIRTSSATDYHRPINTGFGLTQVLPVVVAALSAREEDLLLIENPAAHLHPAGQARMGHFLAEVAAAGVQVLVETHSDHVLNGIRRAVKDHALPNGDVKLHFFRPRSEQPDDAAPQTAPQVESPAIDANGNLDRWPDGFFDQFDKDMNYFAGWD